MSVSAGHLPCVVNTGMTNVGQDDKNRFQTGRHDGTVVSDVAPPPAPPCDPVQGLSNKKWMDGHFKTYKLIYNTIS